MQASTAGSLVLTLVALQLLATLLIQHVCFDARFGMLDMLGILPRWKFFIHERSTFDLAIEFRERSNEGEPSAWRTVWAPSARSRWNWLWNPDKIGDGVIWLAICTLDQRSSSGKPACPATSSSYAALLELCRKSSVSCSWCEGQFALVRIKPGEGRTTRYISPFHRL